MSLIEINWNPDRRELRKFGLIALFVLGIAGVILRFIFGVAAMPALVVAAFGLFIFIVTLVSARAARAIYLGLTFAALPIGLVISVILMAAFYFLILTPVGLVFKIMGRDPLLRRFEPGASTYWCKRRNADDPERYFHQF